MFSRRLSSEQQRILQAIQEGCHLKVHRTMDGSKVYRLHGVAPSGEEAEEVLAPGLVEALERGGYVQSNLKFPAASLLLTERGAQAAPAALHPLGPRNY